MSVTAPTWTQGDTSPALSGTCTAGTPPTPVDLSAATVAVHIGWADGAVLSRLAVVTDATAGRWRLDWLPGDLAVPGRALLEVEVTWAGGRVETFGPTVLFIRPQIA